MKTLLLFALALLAAPSAKAQGAGTLDAFNPSVTGGFGYVIATAVLPDGRTIIGGHFTTVGGAAHANIARLNANGSVDATFNASTNSEVYSVAVQADGKLVIGGYFTSVNGSVVSTTTGLNNIARLNADGTLDTTFNTGLGGVNGVVFSVAVQADGKLVLGGGFTSVNGSTVSTTTGVNSIARLHADGTLDTAFNASLGGANNVVISVAVQADDKLVLGGYFTSVNGSAVSTTTGVNYIARLNADGTRDTAFNAGLGGANNRVTSVAVQADGKLVIGGDFTSVNGSTVNAATGVNRIARLHTNGTRDTAFNAGLGGASNQVNRVALQADGKVVIGGYFTGVNGTTRRGIARLTNDAATQSLSVPNATQAVWTRGGAAPELSAVTFELSTNGGSTWTALGTGTRVGSTPNWELTSLSLPGSGQLRARGHITTGGYNGTSGLIEQIAGFGPDTDSDGLLDSWELSHWPSITSHGPLDDDDHDGLVNLLELAFGLNPTLPHGVAPPPATNEGDYLTMTLTKQPGVSYEVQSAGSLLPALPDSFSAASTTVLINNATTLKVRDNFLISTSPPRFMRVKVTAAP